MQGSSASSGLVCIEPTKAIDTDDHGEFASMYCLNAKQEEYPDKLGIAR
jgi:hypothetical protein